MSIEREAGPVESRRTTLDSGRGLVGSVSQYREAVEETERSIQRRSAWFRNQVVSLVVLVLGIIGTALIAGSAPVLAGGLLVIPLSGAFLLADARLVTRWTVGLLEAWSEKRTDIAALTAAIRAHPKLPSSTVEAMLATLPSSGHLTEEQAIGGATRRAIAAVVIARSQGALESLLLKVIASAVAVSMVLVSFWSGAWWPLTGLASLLALPIVSRLLRRRRRAACDATVGACRKEPGFDEAAYARICAVSG